MWSDWLQCNQRWKLKNWYGIFGGKCGLCGIRDGISISKEDTGGRNSGTGCKVTLVLGMSVWYGLVM